MSGNTWLTADPHFGHANILNFKRSDDTPLRPFKSVEEMDETLVNNWNKRVHPKDRVYVLGDVVMHRRNMHILGRLQGRLVLVKGNHDIFALKDYLPYFDDIRAYVVKHTTDKRKVIMSHIPIQEQSLGRWGINIHGHLHSGTVGDPRYLCVSVEHTDYAPIEWNEALKRVPDPS